jgi:tetratricopeptide (TPR) repeat protein
VRARWARPLEGRLFLSLEYVPPPPGAARRTLSLADYLGGEPLPLPLVLRWSLEICYGLQHAHSRGVACHRDLKPSNVLVTHDNHLKVSDFGLAIPIGSLPGAHRMGRQATRAVVGTPGYLAPEQYRGEPLDARTDVYAFGLILHQMVVGSSRPPFVDGDAPDAERTYNRQMGGPPRGAEGPLRPVVEKCLAPDPADRYPDCRALRADLSAVHLEALGSDPEPPAARLPEAWEKVNRAVSLLSLDETAESIRLCDEVLALLPNSVPALNNRGAAHAAAGEHTLARADYSEALLLAPNDPRIHCNRAASWLAEGDPEAALADYSQALALDRRHAAAYRGRALVHSRRRDLTAALADYDAAIRTAPGDPISYFDRGSLLAEIGRADDSLADYSHAIALDPLFAPAYCNRGLLHLRQGQPRAALKDLGVATRLRPHDAQSWARLARALLAAGNLSPADAMLLSDRGNICAAAGDLQRAAADYRESLARDAARADIWLRRGVVEERLGCGESAACCYRRVLALGTSAESEREWATQRLRALDHPPQTADENSEKTE